MPLTGVGGTPEVDLSILLPLADAALRGLRHGDGLMRALNVDIERHLILVAVPCNSWDDVRQVEHYIEERLEFAVAPDPKCIGVFFSGYQPLPGSSEERIFAIKLGTVGGGWGSAYRAILGPHATGAAVVASPNPDHEIANGTVRSGP